MTRTGQAAIDYARSRKGANSMSEPGMCLKFTRQCFEVPSYYASAVDAGYGCNVKHPGDWNPPPATPVWFRSPSVYDHVCFYVSEHEVISTFNADVRAFDGIQGIQQNFDAQYVGWGEDINEVRVYTPGSGGGGTTPGKDDDMLVIQAPNRGVAVCLGSKVISIGDGATADAIVAAGGGRAVISDADFDRMRFSGTSPLLIKAPSYGYALLSGSEAIGIGDTRTVHALQGVGIASIDVIDADFMRMVTNIEANP